MNNLKAQCGLPILKAAFLEKNNLRMEEYRPWAAAAPSSAVPDRLVADTGQAARKSHMGENHLA